MDLKKIKNISSFDGIMAVSDIHSEWKSTKDLCEYATKHNLFIVFMGDLIDGGSEPEKVLDKVANEYIAAHRAALVIGNHEYKFYRHLLGNPVVYKTAQYDTLLKCKDQDNFYSLIKYLCTHENSDFIHQYGNTVFVHGGLHDSYWGQSSDGRITSVQKQIALYGEVAKNQKTTLLSMIRNIIYKYVSVFKGDIPPYIPTIRTYGWCNSIPYGHSVVVGHDRTPFKYNTPIKQPVIYTNMGYGKVYFIDTSSGKIKRGKVTGAVFNIHGDNLRFKEFVYFKNR